MEWSEEVIARSNPALYAFGGSLALPGALPMAAASVLESALKLAEQAAAMPKDADIVMFGTLNEDRSVRVGVAARIGDGWTVVSDLGISREKKISTQFAILGKF